MKRLSRSSLAGCGAGAAGWGAFCWFVIARATDDIGALGWQDTQAYEKVASAPLFSSGFWAASRPPLIPLIMKIAGHSQGFLYLQTSLAVLAWGFLAWSIARQLQPGWRRLLVGWAILAFATSLPVTMWDRSLLSETTAISLIVLLFGLLIWTAENPTIPRILATSFICLLLAFARDEEIYVVVVLVVVTLVVHAFRGRPSLEHFAQRMGILSFAMALAVAPAFALQVVSHRSALNIEHDFEVRVFPYPQRVAWFAQHGMPDARLIDSISDTAKPPRGNPAVVIVPARVGEFAPLYRWISVDGTRTYMWWLVSHPAELLFLPLDSPEEAYSFAGGNLNFYAPSEPPIPSPLGFIAWPGALWLYVLAGTDLLIGWLSGLMRSRVYWSALGFTALGLIAMLIAWQGDGQEVTRHTIEGFVQVRVGLWAAFVIGLSGISIRRLREVFGVTVSMIWPSEKAVPSQRK